MTFTRESLPALLALSTAVHARDWQPVSGGKDLRSFMGGRTLTLADEKARIGGASIAPTPGPDSVKVTLVKGRSASCVNCQLAEQVQSGTPWTEIEPKQNQSFVPMQG